MLYEYNGLHDRYPDWRGTHHSLAATGNTEAIQDPVTPAADNTGLLV